MRVFAPKITFASRVKSRRGKKDSSAYNIHCTIYIYIYTLARMYGWLLGLSGARRLVGSVQIPVPRRYPRVSTKRTNQLSNINNRNDAVVPVEDGDRPFVTIDVRHCTRQHKTNEVQREDTGGLPCQQRAVECDDAPGRILELPRMKKGSG